MKKRIIFRADGNEVIGFGHFYRLLALADMLKDEFYCCFAINRPDSVSKSRILDTCELLELDLPYTYPIPDMLSARNGMPFDLTGIVHENDVVVLDGYHFMQTYQEALFQQGCKQVVIDDLGGNYPYAEAIINHAPGIEAKIYNSNARLCLGLDYALLRKPFITPFKKTASTGKVYVSMGGSDRNGLTVTVCKGLLLAKRFDSIHILCSDKFPEDQVKTLRLLEKTGIVILHFNLNAEMIVDIMAECHFAFVSASTVMIEAYARGLLCFAGYSALNQSLLYAGFVQNSFCVELGNLQQMTAEEIAGINFTGSTKDISILSEPLDPVAAYRELFNELVYADA